MKAKALRMEYRCNGCGFRDVLQVDASWDVVRRAEEAHQRHDAIRPDPCAEWKPRFGQVVEVKG